MKFCHFKKLSFFLLFLFFALNFSFSQEFQSVHKYLRNEDYKSVIKICEDEIQKNPSNMKVYSILCSTLIENKQYAEAELWASQGLLLFPYDQNVTEVLGEAKYYLGKNDEALLLFQNYISLVQNKGSKLADVYYFTGEIFIRKGMFNHADIAFSQAVKNEPLKDNWWLRLGYAREKAKNYKLASIAYDQALQINPQNNDAKTGKRRVQSKIR